MHFKPWSLNIIYANKCVTVQKSCISYDAKQYYGIQEVFEYLHGETGGNSIQDSSGTFLRNTNEGYSLLFLAWNAVATNYYLIDG